MRSGGHSVAAHCVSDGIVLDLSAMKAMDVDVEGRTAWAETGLTAGEFTTAAAAHGLALGFGDTGSVGIGGITLGGGVGFLLRKYGLTIDDLLAAEIVTADGETPPRRRGHAPGPVLGDPRRWRQRRRRDAIPVPPARTRHGRRRDAHVAGHAGDDRGVRGGGRRGTRGALGDRERDARAADALHPGGVARRARDPRAAVFTRAMPMPARRRSRRSAPWRSRWPTCSGRCPIRRSTCRKRRATTRPRSRGRCSWTRSTVGERKRSSSSSGHRARRCA